MTDERKYALLLAATILAACKRASLDSTTGATPAKTCAVEDAIDKAKFILDRIEARWPSRPYRAASYNRGPFQRRDCVRVPTTRTLS
jgi:hypothetical protein